MKKLFQLNKTQVQNFSCAFAQVAIKSFEHPENFRKNFLSARFQEKTSHEKIFALN